MKGGEILCEPSSCVTPAGTSTSLTSRILVYGMTTQREREREIPLCEKQLRAAYRMTINWMTGADCAVIYVWSSYIPGSKSMDRPGKVADPARGQLNRENEYSPDTRI